MAGFHGWNGSRQLEVKIRFFLQARREVLRFPIFGISGGVRALCPSRGANGQILGGGGQPYLDGEKCGRSTSSRRTGHHLGRGAPDIEAAARRIIQLARPVLPPPRRQWHLTRHGTAQGHATKFTLLEKKREPLGGSSSQFPRFQCPLPLKSR